MAVITISRQFGAGGRTLGGKLAKRLGYRYVHEDMIREIALKAEVVDKRILQFERRGTSKLLQFLDKIVTTSYVERLTSDKYGYVDEEIYVDAVKKVVQELYEYGNVVIIGRGSQYILKNGENARHVFLVADLDHRIRFLMDHYDLVESAARRAITRADRIRSRFLNIFADQQFHDNPITYDLSLNMSRISMEQAELFIADLVENK